MLNANATITAEIEAEAERLLSEAANTKPDHADAAPAPSAEVVALHRKDEADQGDRSPAAELLDALGRDIEQTVRDALSECVMMCSFLPNSMATALADDVSSLVRPVIPYAGVLNGEERAAISRMSSEPRTPKIARQALIDQHLTLPLTISARLIAEITEALCELLVIRHELPRQMAEELKLHGRERALTQVMAADFPAAEFEQLADDLMTADMLTPTLILRTLCVGNLDFFQTAMAARAKISVAEANQMIFGRDRKALEEIYDVAGLPAELFIAYRTAVEVINRLRYEERPIRGLEITEWIMAQLRVEYDNVCPEGLEHTLSQLSRFVLGRSIHAVRGFA